jgi:hypothetical protein
MELTDDPDFIEAIAHALVQLREVKKKFYRHIERALVSQIEIIEGHMPSDAEISKHALRAENPEGTHVQITWRGELILDAQVSFTDTEVSYEVKVRHKVDLSEEIPVDLE